MRDADRAIRCRPESCCGTTARIAKSAYGICAKGGRVSGGARRGEVVSAGTDRRSAAWIRRALLGARRRPPELERHPRTRPDPRVKGATRSRARVTKGRGRTWNGCLGASGATWQKPKKGRRVSVVPISPPWTRGDHTVDRACRGGERGRGLCQARLLRQLARRQRCCSAPAVRSQMRVSARTSTRARQYARHGAYRRHRHRRPSSCRMGWVTLCGQRRTC